ncbi:MAG: MBL fold metallo-hydrolase [Actinomycetota bacterium]
MIFRQLLHEERSCASYLIGCPSLGVAGIVDPQGDPAEYVYLAQRHGLRITDVLDTHVHADHPSAAYALASRTGARLRLGAGAEVGFDFSPLVDGDVLQIGNRRMVVIAIPGHTEDHVGLLVDDWFVLTGDTLFVGDVGRVDLADSDLDESELEVRARTLHASLQRLMELEDHIEVYPGHYAGSTCGRGIDGKPVSTIGRERRHNRALQLDVEQFVRYQLEDIPPLPQDFRAIKHANRHDPAAASVLRR